MTICYFTASGNCLYVARRIGGTLLSQSRSAVRCDRDQCHAEEKDFSVQIGNLNLRNRIVIPPMATGRAKDGKPGDDLVVYRQCRMR